MPASNLKPGRPRLLGALPVLVLLSCRVCAALWLDEWLAQAVLEVQVCATGSCEVHDVDTASTFFPNESSSPPVDLALQVIVGELDDNTDQA